MLKKEDVPVLWGFDFRTSPRTISANALVLQASEDSCCYQETREFFNVADMVTVLQQHAEWAAEEAMWLTRCCEMLQEHGSEKILSALTRVESVATDLREAVTAAKFVSKESAQIGTYMANLVEEFGSLEGVIVDRMQSASRVYATLSAEDKVLAEVFGGYRNKLLADAISEAYGNKVIHDVFELDVPVRRV